MEDGVEIGGDLLWAQFGDRIARGDAHVRAQVHIRGDAHRGADESVVAVGSAIRDRCAVFAVALVIAVVVGRRFKFDPVLR